MFMCYALQGLEGVPLEARGEEDAHGPGAHGDVREHVHRAAGEDRHGAWGTPRRPLRKIL